MDGLGMGIQTIWHLTGFYHLILIVVYLDSLQTQIWLTDTLYNKI